MTDRMAAVRRSCWYLGLLATMLLISPRTAAQTGSLDLTPLETAWIEQHPVVRVGISREFPPFYMYDESAGQPHGFVIEMMALWSQRTGLRFEYRRYGAFSEVLEALQHGDVEMTPFTVPLKSRQSFASFTRPAYFSNLVLAARRDVPDISSTADFGGRRVAIQAGSSVESLFLEQYPNAYIERFESAEVALRAVAGGQSDLFVGYQHVAVYQIERLLLANIELRRNLGPGSVPLGPAVRMDQPHLRSILDKAIASISATDRSRLAQRWLPTASLTVPLPSESARLSAAELKWVHDKGRVRVGYDASFAPITMRGTLGEFQGYGADIFRLVANKAGLTVEMESGASFAEVYEAGKLRRLDVVVGMARTPQRRADYDFVGPFISMPTVLVTRADEPTQVSETRDIRNRKLALLRGHFMIQELRARHPGIVLVELDRQDQVLSAVAEGAADVALGNLSVVNDLIEQRFAGRVVVSGIVKDGDSELYFAIPRHLPELTRVLSRGFDAVNDGEVAALRAKWLARDVRSGLSWRQVLQVAIPAALLLLSFLFLLGRGNRRLRIAREKERVARHIAEASTAARSRFLAYLSHELRGTLSAITAAVELLRNSGEPELRMRMLDAIQHSSTGLLKMVESTLRHEQTLYAPLQLEAVTTDMVSWWEETLAPAQIAAEQKGLKFIAQDERLAGHMRIDAVRLQQVVQNLLNNAVKFTKAGQIVASAECLRTLQDGSPSARLRVEIRDTGPGLNEADRKVLFRAYAQGEQGRLAKHGAGLGLAISAQIVNAMNGQLEAVLLPPGHGACFVLHIPVALEAAPRENIGTSAG